MKAVAVYWQSVRKECGYLMTPEELQSWIDKTLTAVGGAVVLSHASAREVARHALKSLFSLTGNDREASLQAVQKIDDFAVRRRLLEVFRRSYVETSASFTSEIFFRAGSLSNADFADAFDKDLLSLWRHAGQDRAQFDALIKTIQMPRVFALPSASHRKPFCARGVFDMQLGARFLRLARVHRL